VNTQTPAPGADQSAETNTVRPVIPVQQIVVHKDPHLDELMAIFLLRRFGEAYFPGVKTAKVRFTDHLTVLPDSEFDRDGILPIGCGGGRFDEHRGELERLPNECSTTLVAKYLPDVYKNPSLRPLIDEVLRCDTDDGVKNTELAEIIKLDNRQSDKSPDIVVIWGLKAIEAIYMHTKMNYTAPAGEMSLRDIFNKFKGRNRFKPGPALDSTERFVKGSTTRKDASLTELGHVVECLYRSGVISNSDEVEEWVLFALDRLYRDQVAFWEAVEEVRSRGDHFVVRALLRGQEVNLKAVMIHSQSKLVARAARTKASGGSQIVIVRNPVTRQVQVFVDTSKDPVNKRPVWPGLNLADFTRMIRWLELPKAGPDSSNDPSIRRVLAGFDWMDLAAGGEGTHSANCHWYYFRQAQQLLNGSHTHPGVKSTEMLSSALKDVALHAFHPGLTRRWMSERGIPIPQGKGARPEPVPQQQGPRPSRKERRANLQPRRTDESLNGHSPEQGAMPRSETPVSGEQSPETSN